MQPVVSFPSQSVLLHVCASAHLPQSCCLCTLAPVFSQAEEEAAE